MRGKITFLLKIKIIDEFLYYFVHGNQNHKLVHLYDYYVNKINDYYVNKIVTKLLKSIKINST